MQESFALALRLKRLFIGAKIYCETMQRRDDFVAFCWSFTNALKATAVLFLLKPIVRTGQLK